MAFQGLVIDLFHHNDYFTLKIIYGGESHGPEKSREAQKSEDQPQARGTLSQAGSKGLRKDSHEMYQMRWPNGLPEVPG